MRSPQCDDEAMPWGKRELEQPEAWHQSRVRRTGGGRKAALATIAGLNEAFLSVLAKHTAGSPMAETIKWTKLTRHEFARLLRAEGMSVSVTVVDQLLEKHNYRKRKAQKRSRFQRTLNAIAPPALKAAIVEPAEVTKAEKESLKSAIVRAIWSPQLNMLASEHQLRTYHFPYEARIWAIVLVPLIPLYETSPGMKLSILQ